MAAFEFNLGDIVYLKVDDDSDKGQITGIVLRPGHHMYCVSWPDKNETRHFAIELTTDKTFGILN